MKDLITSLDISIIRCIFLFNFSAWVDYYVKLNGEQGDDVSTAKKGGSEETV